MSDADLQGFRAKVEALQAFLALSEARPELGEALRDCAHHHQVVALARRWGFEIGRRWGETAPAPGLAPQAGGDANLLASACPDPGHETSTTLLSAPGLRLELIHSCRAESPEGFWYDQSEEEWVCLLQGSARLRFADEAMDRQLCRGDSLLIRAHRRHRLVESDPAPGTLWLALFWTAPPAAA
ncbi:MAG: Nif11 domain/cupin domain-containing protein [Synechococcaceae cyanobacterium]|nr:Nif11 domain/cupin domain-containing protein [Synechococcaceae cyanobacterium]